MEQNLFEYSCDKRSPTSNKKTPEASIRSRHQRPPYDHFRVPIKLRVPNVATGAQTALDSCSWERMLRTCRASLLLIISNRASTMWDECFNARTKLIYFDKVRWDLISCLYSSLWVFLDLQSAAKLISKSSSAWFSVLGIDHGIKTTPGAERLKHYFELVQVLSRDWLVKMVEVRGYKICYQRLSARH